MSSWKASVSEWEAAFVRLLLGGFVFAHSASDGPLPKAA
jgi:hypothetical protein